ncbi:MAG: hypothetical protein WBY53_14995 [Acidobacteriaceae bacterium]
MNRSLRIATTLAVAAPLFLLIAGCHVTENDHGDSKNVDIGTPFGSMKVDTNKNEDASNIGIAIYPGATPVEDKGDDNNNANISMSFGGFHLGVKAADFQTPDSQDKVLAFYQKDLSNRYGAPIECRGHNAIGSVTHTSQGLTCSDDQGSHIKTRDNNHNGIAIMSGDSSTDIELRAGSPQHLHIVGVETNDGGTKIGLVSLDLPSHLSSHDRSDSE